MKIGSIIVILTLVVAAAGCSNSNTRSQILNAQSTGTAIPGFNFSSVVVGNDHNAFYLVSEAAQAGTDLNGDGDAADNVVHMVDTDTLTVTNLGISGRLPLLRTATRVVWPTAELEQGGIDLNGDGDTADEVLVVFDPAMPVSPTNPMITTFVASSAAPRAIWGDQVVIVTAEADVGSDLNADGDTLDSVVQVFDALTLTLVSTGQAWDAASASLSVGSGVAVWLVPEADQGMADLNVDGDTSDTVVFGFDLGAMVSFPVGSGTPRAASTFLPKILGTSANPVVAYAIDESAEGGVSFNAASFSDSDNADFVLALFDVNTGVETLPFGGIAVDAVQITGNDTRCAFVAIESDNTGISVTDLNSDGDDTDEIPFWVDLAAPATANNLGLASMPGAAVLNTCDQFVLFIASETDQGPAGTNFNTGSGDTDVSDGVAFYADISAPGIPSANSGMAATDSVCFSGGFFLIVPEADQGDTDVNFDGDSSDIVPVYFVTNGPTITEGLRPVITDGPLTFQVCPSVVRIIANISEASGFGDLNEDGDETDFHLRVSTINRANGRIDRNTFLLNTDMDGTAFPFLLDADTVMWPFFEGNVRAGFDLNGDGDFSDTVLRWYNSNCP